MRTTRSCCAAACAVAVALLCWCAPPALAEETIENDLYKHWAQFKPGTFCTLKSVSKAMGQTTESTLTTTLKSVTKEKVVLEIVSVSKVAGRAFKSPPQKIEHRARIPKPKAEELKKGKGADPGVKSKEGEEALRVKGKLLKTKWHETTFKQGKTTTHTRSWMSDEVPGQIVKSVTKTEGQTKMVVEMTLVDFKIIKK